MSSRPIPKSVRECWDLKADEWNDWIGEEGDRNRIHNTDPVLWRFLGEVRNLDVLDAGCGTGYLSKKLADRGARVTSIDISPKMIEIARTRNPEARVESASELATVADESMDRVVSNYVLQDLPDLPGAVSSFFRVLRPGGRVVVVFTHPCFGVIGGPEWLEGDWPRYTWTYPYFSETEEHEEWGPFQSAFLWYHRPLSTYWRRFKEGGFQVLDFDEPVIQGPRPGTMEEQRYLRAQRAPWSVAFLLRKSGDSDR